MKLYYSVRIDKKFWSRQAIPVSEFERFGFTIQNARLEGVKDVFMDGRQVAILFETKEDAARFAMGEAA